MVGDLALPASLPAAFTGVDGVFLLAPVGPDETAPGCRGSGRGEAAGVRHIVYLSVVMPPGSDVIPHFASKIPVEQAVRASGFRWTILRPNNFFQNDLWFRDAITTHGVYPQPLGPRGLNRVDVRDIAEAAANAFTEASRASYRSTARGGSPATTRARVYSEILERPVRYGGDDLDLWAKQASAMMPPWMVQDMRIMYDYFIRKGAHASGTDFAAQQNLLGHGPRPFEAFVSELAKEWRK